MITRLILALVLVVFVTFIAGFTVLAIWDMPMKQNRVEKTLDNSRFLQKSS